MRWLRALYVANGFAVGAMYGFVPVLLQAKGFDPALVGVTTSLGSLAYTMALPVWGHVGDEMVGPRRALQLSCIPAAIFAFGLAAPLPVLLVILSQIIFSIASGPGLALTDAMAVPTLENPSREYTKLRWLTSFGAASSAAVCGGIYSVTGYLFAPFVYVLVIAAILGSVRFIKVGAGRTYKAPSRRNQGRGGSIGEAFRVRPRLYGILASVVLVFIGVMSASTYITIRLSDLGGGPLVVGVSNGIGWGAEVFGMMAAGPLIARFGARVVLFICATCFAACIGSWGVLSDPLAIAVMRFGTGVFFAGIFVSFVLTISAILPPHLQSTGQTLFQASCFGLGAVIGNFVGGLLYQEFGPIGVFGGAALCTFAGALLALVVMPGQVEPEALPAIPVSPSIV